MVHNNMQSGLPVRAKKLVFNNKKCKIYNFINNKIMRLHQLYFKILQIRLLYYPSMEVFLLIISKPMKIPFNKKLTTTILVFC